MDRAATIDNPAPDNVASVKSLGIFLHIKKYVNVWSTAFAINSSLLTLGKSTKAKCIT